jgi:hypothetical protein
MQPCTVTAPSGVCGGLVVPGAPVLTIAGCDGSLDGSWPMVPNFSVGTSIYGPVVDSLLSHFDGWVTFGHGIDYGFGPGGAGLDLGDGHHLFAKVTLMGNIAITVRRDSDGATATATTVGSTACAPFQITAAMNLFGADTPVVCPGNPFTVTITA